MVDDSGAARVASVAAPRVRLRESGWLIGVVLLVAGLGAAHVWWIARFRGAFPLDIDESGYLWFSFHLQDVTRADGTAALWNGFQHEGWVAPLLPMLTTFVGLLGAGKGIVASLSVQIAFFAVLVLASYGIGSRLHSRAAGALAALVVAGVPSITDFVRTYHLVISSTSMLTFSAFALIASRRFRNRGWAIAWGVGMGLTLLARSMMLAFVPSVAVAGLLIVLVDRVRGRRLMNFALGLVAFASTSLLWYATSWHPILDYLTQFGYGRRSHAYGPRLSPLSHDWWLHEPTGAVQFSLYLPLTLALLAAFLAAAVGGLARQMTVQRSSVRDIALRLARSDHLVLVVVVAAGYLALSSSSNDGTGFVVPLLPSLVLLAVAALFTVPWRAVRLVLVAGLALVSVFNVVMKADVVSAVSRVHVITVPGWVQVPVTNGEGFVHQNLSGADDIALGSPRQWFPDREKGWPTLYGRIAGRLALQQRPWLHVYFTPQEPILNTSALRMYANRAGFAAADYSYVDTGGDDTAAAYSRFLAQAHPDVLVTTDRSGHSFGSPISPQLVEHAAEASGYRATARFTTPDGRQLRLWTRN
jgi:4-amino-4-deoxy-L-arabinose transferase-like glycosyltransferase